MKLSSKLTLFIAGSKLVTVLLFILVLPYLVKEIANQHTNFTLRQQQKKVMAIVHKNGLDDYLQGESSYGSYTLLKEEFIAFSPSAANVQIDTIKDSQRLIEGDTLNYRILSATFKYADKNYLLEIGKNTSISQYHKPLQRFALYGLITLIAMTMLIDLIFIRIIIQPLSSIIKTKLVNNDFPFRAEQLPVPTSTSDFKYLDDSLRLLMTQINDAFYKEREFTSNASHELMTPITILQNKMENLLDEEGLSDESAIAIVEMMKTVDRLKKITSSLLLISRIENEQYIRKEHVIPLQLFEEIIEEIKHRLEDKNISIKLNIAGDMEFQHVNRDLIYQLFFNLIHNAIKFNRQDGQITITGVTTADGCFQVQVSDTGIGIPKEDLPFIFNRFTKTNLSSQVGYGLGLAIVKSIAAYHAIKIAVESDIGEGTTFTLIFKFKTK
ncbi:sensor histidine kinase [Pedobacter insulae]|uniref:histidine kinase n=1 Tax=Pedobacter insulae TaxID=414048 RepID=A0A1I3A071_9SPHI|nr:HAMP domain-containing sensor histidine kinase [Pedobacter insulae]SFH43454.1 Signal transduction histidine kinase [Pedobacter insulae]